MAFQEFMKFIEDAESEWASLTKEHKEELRKKWRSGLKAAGQTVASLIGPREFRQKFPEGVVEPGEKRTDKPYWKDWHQSQAEQLEPIGELQGKTLTRPRVAEMTLADGSKVRVTFTQLKGEHRNV